MATYLLLHPPLLGPAVWEPLAGLVRARGGDCLVPDLRPALNPAAGWWERAAERCTGAAGGRRGATVLGHSGAGALLPLVADAVDAAHAVFVDAVLPPRAGPFEASPRMREFVATLPAADDLLPAWSDWWPPGTMTELVPDDGLRRRIERDQARLPAAFHAEPVPVPAGWPQARAAYLQLSPAYDAELAEAAARGWPTAALPGRHLDVAATPGLVLGAVTGLLGRITTGR